MSNQHNPIAQRINRIQDLWSQKRALQPDAQIIRWMINENDLPLINGFYKLESSTYGKTLETIVILFTDFESIQTFSYTLAKHWLSEYKKNADLHPELQWLDFNSLQEQWLQLNENHTDKCTEFLIKMLLSFKNYEGRESKMLIGLHPRNIVNNQAMCKWLEETTSQLPKTLGFVVTDFDNRNLFKTLFEPDDEKPLPFGIQTITVPDQNIEKACQQLMTQGNPNDPQVAFRKCMLKMGENAKMQNPNGVIKWGDRGLNITKATGDKAFWASAHLIYASMLFYFKDSERVFKLLNDGIKIGNTNLEDQSLLGVTLQILGFKAAYYNIIGKSENAINEFIEQGDLAKNHKQELVALTAFKNALTLVSLKNKREDIYELSKKAYLMALEINIELLKTTELPFIANLYRQELEIKIQIEKESNQYKEVLKALDEFMEEHFGKDWKELAKITAKSSKPLEPITS